MDKLIIEAFRKENFTDSAGKMIVQYNPAKVSLSWGNKATEKKFDSRFLRRTAAGSPIIKKVIEFEPGTANFELFFDNTLGDKEQSVHNQIEQLQKLCLLPESELHATNYLTLSWGKFLFKCQLTSLSIDYVLFMPDGTPLRAEVRCAFKEFRPALKNARALGYRSPDLTRVVVVHEGDTLPLICYKYYGSNRYYLKVARVNGLASPNSLFPGQKIVLPPLIDDIADYYKEEN